MTIMGNLWKFVLANEQACLCWSAIAYLCFWANFVDTETSTLLLMVAVRTLFWLPQEENCSYD